LNHSLGLEDLTIAALAARNALEMKVWILYAIADERNARRMYDDQMVDARDIMARAESLLTLVPDAERPAGLNSALADSRKVLDEKKSDFGVGDDDRYLRSQLIAQQVGCGNEFKSLSPILSKMLHPTALSMFLNHNGQTGDHQTVQICSVGIHYFASNIDALNAHLKVTGFPYIHQHGETLEIRKQ
jgi:hypothetical protein